MTPWEYLLSSRALNGYQVTQENHIRWSQTPDSHIFSVDLPGKLTKYFHYHTIF